MNWGGGDSFLSGYQDKADVSGTKEELISSTCSDV